MEDLLRSRRVLMISEAGAGRPMNAVDKRSVFGMPGNLRSSLRWRRWRRAISEAS